LRAMAGRRPFVTGEATAEYLSRQKVPAAIKSMVPDIKVVVMLRNPVLRALSDYHMLKRNGMISLSFEYAVGRTLDWLDKEGLADLIDPVSESEHFYGRLVLRGLYANNLRRWLDVFGRQRVLVLSSEAFFDNAQRCVDRVFEFLGLDPVSVDISGVGRKGEYENTVDRELLARLEAFYEPHNQTLYELVGSDFRWERQTLSVRA